jgi:hypothetical protein
MNICHVWLILFVIYSVKLKQFSIAIFFQIFVLLNLRKKFELEGFRHTEQNMQYWAPILWVEFLHFVVIVLQ